MRYVVLLKDGVLQIEACPSDAVFGLASIRKAGICGVFEAYAQATAFIEQIEDSNRPRLMSGSGSGLPSSSKQ
jgi:hypothetical protein